MPGSLLPIPLAGPDGGGESPSSAGVVLEAQLHPTRPWILLALSSGEVRTVASRSGETLHRFAVDQTTYGPLRSACFFDADSLVHVHMLPPVLVAEARANLIVAICAKSIIVYDCVTRTSTPHAPPVLATGLGGAKVAAAAGGALSGAAVGLSCEHLVVGTTFGSLFTFNVKTGVVSAFSGTTKLHEKAIVSIVAITGRPSAQLHRARIVTACAGGVVAVWEVPCETPIYKSGPRVLVQNTKVPVADLRFDSARNRLVCCFANGSAMVWAFEGHTQEEALIVSITKGFNSDQIAIPRGTWNAPDESLLMITPNRGSLALVLPLSTAMKNARQLEKGVHMASSFESKSSTSLASGTSEGVVAIRMVVSIDSESESSSEIKKITKFWQHPSNPNHFLLAGRDSSGGALLYLYDRDLSTPAMGFDAFMMGSGKLVSVLDSRLVIKSGARYNSDKVAAFLSPYVTSDAIPKALKDWTVAGDLSKDTLSGLDLDKPCEYLWPGPVNVTSLRLDDILLLGLVYPEAQRYVVLALGTSESSSVTVVQSGCGGALSLTTIANGDCIAMVGREEEVVVGPSTAMTETRSGSSKGLMQLPSFKSRSFRSTTTTTGTTAVDASKTSSTPSSLPFLSRPKKPEGPKPVTHYYLGAIKIDLNALSTSPPSKPFVEILVNQPVRELMADLGGGGSSSKVFLMRCDPPEKLSKSLKPWTRFFSLSSLLNNQTLSHAGPLLPAHRLVCKWDRETDPSSSSSKRAVTLAVSFEQVLDRIAILDISASDSSNQDVSVRFRQSIFTHSTSPCVSMHIHYGSLFFVTSDKVRVAFIGPAFTDRPSDSLEAPQLVLAGRGRSAHPESQSPRAANTSNNTADRGQQPPPRRDSLHVHEEVFRPEDAAFAPSPSLLREWETADSDSTSSFPVPTMRPGQTNELFICGVERESSDLVLIAPTGKASFISLGHPLTRLGMLAAAGLGKLALQWTHALPESVNARDEAVLMLVKLGFPREAVLVQKASATLLLDICVRYQCVEEASEVFVTAKSLKAFRQLAEGRDSAEGLSSYQRLAMLLVSDGRIDALSTVVQRLKGDRDKEFCNALLTAANGFTGGLSSKKKPTVS